MQEIDVTLSVSVDSPSDLTKVTEHFARALAGLALDDIFGLVTTSKWDDEED